MTTYTYQNGQMIKIPDTVIAEDVEIRESISNTLIVRPGVNVTTLASITGTVRVMTGATLEARGSVSGTVGVEDGARATFHGQANGSINVDRGAVMHLLPGAVALGVLRIEGSLINEGTRGVNVSGRGAVDDREGSTVRRPDRSLPDGTSIYES
ncbi:hypothetical protein [Cryobacterium sp. Y50]|uniref:hypothetical protein n=1 Tax=Cryobacterium sp. Y50 TaxID=2048286 RepID=UPI0011B0D5DC|nr:hypothetical protein [Cryobacterium sp. Y50]